MSSSAGVSSNPVLAGVARWIVVAHLLALTAQIGAAMAYVTGIAMLSGEAATTAYLLHARLAWAVLALGVVQALAVLNPALPGLHWMYRAFVVLVVIGEVLELYVIPRGAVVYHVSAAMVVWGCTLALFVRMLDPQWKAGEAPGTG